MPNEALDMTWLNNDFWEVSTEIHATGITHIQYKYILTYADGYKVVEWESDKHIDLAKIQAEEVQLVDRWNYAGEFENAFFTAPFQQTLLKENETKLKHTSTKSFTHIFKVKAPLLKKNEVVCLCGGSPALGDWNTADRYFTAQKKATGVHG